LHPRTKNLLEKTGLKLHATVMDPLGYLDMLCLLQNTRLMITDSGGLQKEAYFFDKYCLTLRDDTEWPELVAGGFNQLVGADKTLILNTFDRIRTITFPQKSNYFGGGNAASTIAAHIAAFA
jgi:UDP-GlcNAc3NAcA epimerase